jgi:phosphatidylglycerophosphatase C
VNKVTLFDLDGVLTTGDTMTRLVTRRLLRRPLRLVRALPLAILSLAASPESALSARLNQTLVALALKGLDMQEYRTLAIGLGRELAAKPGFVTGQAVLECSNAATHSRTIVVTASERVLARAFLDAVGLAGVELYASELRFQDRAARFERHNVGPAKPARLRAEGIDISRAVFYTDSATDIPLASAVGKTILVNGDARTRRRIQAAVPEADTRQWKPLKRSEVRDCGYPR